MSDRIFKWTLAVQDRQTILMPAGAKILTVQVQFGLPQVWAQCNESRLPPELRKFAMYGTGNVMPPDPGRYIGTLQMENGMLVWHVFEAPIETQLGRWENTIRNWTYAEVVG